jgi:hydroxyacylglutathione hydrolase
MNLNITPIPAFNDNYIWMLNILGSREVAVVDPGMAEPVLRHLSDAGFQLVAILITHHHADHTGGIKDLLDAFPNARVIGPYSSRIPAVSNPCKEGEIISTLGINFQVLEIPGHTLDHIAFYIPPCDAIADGAVFCGDTLFAGGCGRLFEGQPAMMHASLAKLEALPPSTLVFCAHEYTLANLRFALVAEPDNIALQARMRDTQAVRDADRPSLPSSIALERRTNPFLRCQNEVIAQKVAQHSGVPVQDEISTFAQLRAWKDHF